MSASAARYCARVRLVLFLAATLPVLGAAPADAQIAGGPNANARARVDAPRNRAPAVQLPSADAATAARASSRWVLSAPGARRAWLRAIAARYGASVDTTLGTLTLATPRARAAAAELGHRLTGAGPELVARRLSSIDEPGGVVSAWSRSAGDPPSLVPPLTSLATIGIVDDAVDQSIAELSSVDVINGQTPADPHGTMVTSTAAAPYDGAGVVGVAPGARVLNWGTNLTCSDVSKGIVQLVRRGARVVNLSLDFDRECEPLELAVQFAYARGATIVSASGNDAESGNPLSFPASYAHVITAAAISSSLTVAPFSNYDDFVDLAAPGVAVPVDLPLRWDTKDGNADGRTIISGTSFASPFIAGGISWLLGARPKLDPSQVASILRTAARDLELPGWDPYTGYGLLQISAALATPTPPKDLLEPNDAPAYVQPSGSGIFAKPLVWKGGAKVTLSATGDSADDSLDAYRIKLPARSRATVTLRPTTGQADLFGFAATVKSFLNAKPLDASTRSGTRTDTIELRNTGRTARTAFVVVNTTGTDDQRLLSQYTLTIRRLAALPRGTERERVDGGAAALAELASDHRERPTAEAQVIDQ
ncbi:MAG: S8 family serine peptidase [Patulibacter sp.]